MTIIIKVQEVVGIMRGNVEKVLERDQKLSQLDDRADALQQGARLEQLGLATTLLTFLFSQFETQAAKLKRKYWWKNCKMWLILGVVAFVVLMIIIISVTTGKKSDDPNADDPG